MLYYSETEIGQVQIVQICTNKWKENTFIVLEKNTGRCLIIDPGYGYEEISAELKKRKALVQGILATHTHFDHIASVHEVQRDFGNPPFYFHAEDHKTLETANVFTLFLNAGKISMPETSRHITQGEEIALGSQNLQIIHTPGHTPGGCIFSLSHGSALFTGDILLKTPGDLHKLPGFDLKKLASSRKYVFEAFAESTPVFPGHGPVTTLRELKQALVLGNADGVSAT